MFLPEHGACGIGSEVGGVEAVGVVILDGDVLQLVGIIAERGVDEYRCAA